MRRLFFTQVYAAIPSLQFALHKNTAQMNSLWKKLEYFSPANYAARVGSAYRMLMERRPTDAVFQQNFHSAEGWYSQLVFRQPGIKVKIVGRGFDDFFREPVVLHGGRLSRCALTSTLGDCIANSTATAGEQTGVSKLPPVQVCAYSLFCAVAPSTADH